MWPAKAVFSLGTATCTGARFTGIEFRRNRTIWKDETKPQTLPQKNPGSKKLASTSKSRWLLLFFKLRFWPKFEASIATVTYLTTTERKVHKNHRLCVYCNRHSITIVRSVHSQALTDITRWPWTVVAVPTLARTAQVDGNQRFVLVNIYLRTMNNPYVTI